MRVPFSELVGRRAPGSAVGAFTCYDLEVARAVLQTAATRDQPVILLVGCSTFAAPGGAELTAALCAVADASSCPALVQLDHCSDLALIEQALELGAGAVMADGSQLPFADNLAFIRAAVAAAARTGAAVEAELGHIAGDEDVARAAAAGALTDPDEAETLHAETGIDCLAVSIGNVHGHYRDPPDLDMSRLAAIRERVPTALSLHGASGIPNAMVRDAIGRGIAKINVNTELRSAYLRATKAALPGVMSGLDVQTLHEAQVSEVAGIVDRKLATFGVGQMTAERPV